MGCGNPKLSETLRERLEGLGQALDQKRQLRVFDGGLVGFNNETESEVIENVTGKEAGSSAWPWPGRPAWPRQQRPRRGEWWWPPGASGSLSAFAQLEWLDGLGSLVGAYARLEAYWFFCFSEWYATNRVNSGPLSDLWQNYYRPLVADGLEIPSLRYVLEDRVRSRGAGQGEWRNYLRELSMIARTSGKPLSPDVEDKIRNDHASN